MFVKIGIAEQFQKGHHLVYIENSLKTLSCETFSIHSSQDFFEEIS
jgi:hypothetical protein